MLPIPLRHCRTSLVDELAQRYGTRTFDERARFLSRATGLLTHIHDGYWRSELCSAVADRIGISARLVGSIVESERAEARSEPPRPLARSILPRRRPGA